MIPRTLSKELRKWSQDKDRKPLVLRGARQVGKTTIVRQFAKEFDQYIELNLENPEDLKIFNQDYSFKQLHEAIFFLKDANKNVPRTLIFIDEIQNSPKAVNKLRYFYEGAPELFVIAAGSLLESLIDKKISFPVGRVDFLALRPCSFREFLLAADEEKSKALVDSAEIPEYAHDKLMELFRKYTIIGGMPEVLTNYAQNQDLNALPKIYERLIISYQDDVEKYADTPLKENVLRHIIGSAFQYAGQRITFDKFGGSNYRSKEMGEAFRTLEKTMLLKLVYPITHVKIPAEEKHRRSPKLILFDTGLVNHSAGTQKQLFISHLIDEVYQGKIAEHIVAQELLALNHSVRTRLNFWVREERNSQAETDYVLPYEDKLIPVEVKYGASGRLRSLHMFMDAAPHNQALRVYSGAMKVEDLRTQSGKSFRLISLPFYLVSQIEKILDRQAIID